MTMKTQGEFLEKFYKTFQKNRPALSRRAFAKFLRLPAPRLHDFMTDKRILTSKSAEEIATRLKIDGKEKELFLEAVSLQRKRSRKKEPVITISLSDFRKISEWYFFAILALADTVDFKSDLDWIARRLDIKSEQAKAALTILTDLGFLKKIEDEYALSNTLIETESDIPSEDLRKSHKQSLQNIIGLIDTVETAEREMRSTTFAGDPQKLKLAKTMIRSFSQKIVSLFESGKRTEVYELNIQLFPISKKLNSPEA